MLDDFGDAFELVAGRVGGVGEQRGLTECHASEVLHGTEGEVGDRDEVELVAWVRLVEVLGVVTQRVRAGFESKGGQMLLACGVDHAKGGSVHIHGVGDLERADDEGDQIRRHRDGFGEFEATLAAGKFCRAEFGTVRDREEVRFDLERDGENSLAIRFVPAGERPSCVGRFELGRRDDVFVASLVTEGAAIKAAELVVENAGEIALEDIGTRQDLARCREGDPLEILVEGDVEIDSVRRVIGPAQRGVGDLKLLSVADDRARRRRHVEVDPLTAEKCRSAQVRRDCELVARRYDVAGEPEVLLVGVQSHGHRRLVHVTWRPPSTDEMLA